MPPPNLVPRVVHLLTLMLNRRSSTLGYIFGFLKCLIKISIRNQKILHPVLLTAGFDKII
jgi:hypothetical protein